MGSVKYSSIISRNYCAVYDVCECIEGIRCDINGLYTVYHFPINDSNHSENCIYFRFSERVYQVHSGANQPISFTLYQLECVPCVFGSNLGREYSVFVSLCCVLSHLVSFHTFQMLRFASKR